MDIGGYATQETAAVLWAPVDGCYSRGRGISNIVQSHSRSVNHDSRFYNSHCRSWIPEMAQWKQDPLMNRDFIRYVTFSPGGGRDFSVAGHDYSGGYTRSQKLLIQPLTELDVSRFFRGSSELNGRNASNIDGELIFKQRLVTVFPEARRRLFEFSAIWICCGTGCAPLHHCTTKLGSCVSCT
jgi:hypothetical protein